MPAKYSSADIDQFVSEYLSGKSAIIIGREKRASPSHVLRLLRKRDIPIRAARGEGRRLPLNAEDIADLYASGLSENQIAIRFGVSRGSITKRLSKLGVTRRTKSEAERVKWSKMTAGQRKAQVAAAHVATKGMARRFDHSCRIADGRMRLCNHTSHYDIALDAMLRERGITPVPQQAIGPYNCDLGAFPVAVEIYGGNYHWSGLRLERTPERFRYIMNAGWHILVIKATKRLPIRPAVADYVVAFIERARRNPALRREYWVVRGAGKLITRGSIDDDKIAIVPALARRPNGRALYPDLPR